ncbi:unnamed protein product [Alopecurus aequalis]
MDVEAPKDTLVPPAPAQRGKAMHRLLVALNCGMLILGTTGGPLLSRLYYSKGGHRQWLSAWLETGGWPLLLIPVVASYLTRRSRDPSAPLVLTPPRILLAAAALGLATGADDFIYAYGLSYLPVSTSAILISTQLAFTVFFAFLIVRQRLTASSLNAVALLTIGAVVLGLHASSDRPAGVSKGQYWLGFFLSLGAAALYGLVLPLVELTYKRAAGGGRVVTYALVMEMQLVMGFFATAFCTVGMIVNNDFQMKDAHKMYVALNAHNNKPFKFMKVWRRFKPAQSGRVGVSVRPAKGRRGPTSMKPRCRAGVPNGRLETKRQSMRRRQAARKRRWPCTCKRWNTFLFMAEVKVKAQEKAEECSIMAINTADVSPDQKAYFKEESRRITAARAVRVAAEAAALPAEADAVAAAAVDADAAEAAAIADAETQED